MSKIDNIYAAMLEHQLNDLYDQTVIELILLALENNPHHFIVHSDLETEHYEFGKELIQRDLFQLPYEDGILLDVVASDGYSTSILAGFGDEDRTEIMGYVLNEIFQPMAVTILHLDGSTPREYMTPEMRRDRNIRILRGDRHVAYTLAPIRNPSDRKTEIIAGWGGYAEIAIISLPSILMSPSYEKQTTDYTKLNRRRAQKGEAPLAPLTTVRIKGQAQRQAGIGEGGERRAPRSHFRRGHLRTIHRDTEQQRIVPVAPTIVGDADGAVRRTYLKK